MSDGVTTGRTGTAGTTVATLLRIAVVAAAPIVFATAATVVPAVRAQAQTPSELEQSRRRLEEIRRERERLRARQQQLEGQAHDVSEELVTLERQREITGRLVNEIDRQISGLNNELDRSSAELQLTEDNLADRRAVLHRRLVEIYKRGPMYAFEALLAAESFGDLLSRYKYLYLTSRQDRALVADIETLRKRVTADRNKLLAVRTELDNRRQEREAELQKFGTLAQARARKLAELRQTARATQRRLS
ncbi:MAG: PcsB-like coiled-coil domain-containing protein, partial [Gemmatimonadota bacterium]